MHHAAMKTDSGRACQFRAVGDAVFRRRGMRSAVAVLCMVCCGPIAVAASAAPPDPVRDFVSRHCVACHGPDAAAAGRRFDTLPLGADAADVDLLALIHDRVRDGEMPPRDEARPAADERDQFLAALTRLIVAGEDRGRADRGNTLVRRMNRVEYEHTLRDLLDLPTLGVQDSLPEDGRRHGFDKAAQGLELSAVHMQKYLAASERALGLARDRDLGQAAGAVWREKAIDEPTARTAISLNSAVPLLGHDLAPGIYTYFPEHSAAEPGTWRKAAFSGDADSVALLAHVLGGHAPQGLQLDRFEPPVVGLYTLRFSTWGLRWERTKAGPSVKGEIRRYVTCEPPYVLVPGTDRWTQTPRKEPICHADKLFENVEFHGPGEVAQILRVSIGERTVGYFDAPSLRPTVHEIEVALRPGDRLRFHAMSTPLEGPPAGMGSNGAQDYEGPGVAFDFFEIEGPRPAAAAPLFATADTSPSPAAARDAIRAFAARAFRRPVGDAEAARFTAIMERQVRDGATWNAGLLTACQAILCAPDFLLIGLESGLPPPGRDGGPAPLGGHALASRLSFFLWDSLPDARLLELAGAGRLTDRDVLLGEVERMLADRRSDRFVRHFLDEWLDLRNIDFTTPDQDIYPDFDPWLRDSMLAETRATLRRMLDQDRGVRELVAADTVLIDERLAVLYGIRGVHGAAIREVRVPAGSPRGGLLAQGSVLKVTANGTTTSPVLRGAWIMERILGQRRRPPPPGVGVIKPDVRGGTTVREQLDLHRDAASCAACHARMDPYGFALESFDPIGNHRDRYRIAYVGEGAARPADSLLVRGVTNRFRPVSTIALGPPVDPSGELPDGRPFRDLADLRRLLLEDEKPLARNLARQLTIYATGADLGFADRAAIERIVDQAAPTGHGFRSLVRAVVASDLFLQAR